jgi:Flp pilus assembly pilin Flp
MKNQFISMLSDDSGQGLIEYAILVGFIAVVAAIAIKPLGVKVASEFTKFGTELP